mmetsp:Transcript_2633/g.6646  ORF Transcript_2633/g.6646 Transcript_2633/m.6646 type:complete len:95 (+) Transcript_2633:205-489(+)
MGDAEGIGGSRYGVEKTRHVMEDLFDVARQEIAATLAQPMQEASSANVAIVAGITMADAAAARTPAHGARCNTRRPGPARSHGSPDAARTGAKT